MNKTEFRDSVMENLVNQAGIEMSKAEAGRALDIVFDTVLENLQKPGEKVTLGSLGKISLKAKAAKPATEKKIFGIMTKIKAKPATLKPFMSFTKGIKETATKLARTKAFKEHIATNGK